VVRIIKRPKAILAKIEARKENLNLKNSQLEIPTIKPTKASIKDEGKKIIDPNMMTTIAKALINLWISISYSENLKYLQTFYFF
jgi:hypothetical protein